MRSDPLTARQAWILAGLTAFALVGVGAVCYVGWWWWVAG